MTITIELTSEEAAQLLETANRQSQPPEEVAHRLMHGGLFPAAMPLVDQAPVSAEAQDALVQHLLDAGLMTERATRPLGPPPPPIVVSGPPVSQTLLEERH